MSVQLTYRNSALIRLNVHDHNVTASLLAPDTITLDLESEEEPDFFGYIFLTQATAKTLLAQLEAIAGVGEGGGS